MKKLFAVFVVAIFAAIAVAGPVAVPALRPAGGFNPLTLPNTAAIYSLQGSASDATYILGSNKVILIADRSANAPQNCLVLNGIVGNYASTPDSTAISIVGDIDIRADLEQYDWTPSSYQMFISNHVSPYTTGYELRGQTGSTGKLEMVWGDGSAEHTIASTTGVPNADFSRLQVRATLQVNDGSSHYIVNFYTRAAGTDLSVSTGWSALGSAVTTSGTTAIGNPTVELRIGQRETSVFDAGAIYRTIVMNGINGTIALDANFSLPAKLATSFTESSVNAATITINTTGDTGAHISGVRDLVQMTSTKRPSFSSASGYNVATFDGSDDYLKSGGYVLNQPSTVYNIGSQITFVNLHGIFDGFGTSNRMALGQISPSPNLQTFAGTLLGPNVDLPLNTAGVMHCVFNGASSSIGINLHTLVTGNAGASNGCGFTLSSSYDGTLAGNTTFSEAILRSVADNATLQNMIASFEIHRWGITP